MAVVIELRDGTRATCENYEWSCDDSDLLELLNLSLDRLGPSGGDPDPDYHLAQKVIGAMGGKVISHDKVEYVPGRVY